jgi:hypothetical protein
LADTQSNPPDIKSLAPKGINLRVDKNALPEGFCEREHGLWPKRTGSRSRLPGKTILRQVGNDVNQLHQTFGGPGILMQIGDTLQYQSLDTLLGRATTSSLTASVGNEEDQVGMAVIVQTESNTDNGGSIDGFLSGSSSASADTFYGRRLTNMWVNETVSALQTVNTFTASTGGAGAASTAGQFVLVPGTYRIEISLSYALSSISSSVVAGLYNATSAAFETYAGTSEPILATMQSSVASFPPNDNLIKLSAAVTVSSSNKTFEIRQKAGDTTFGRALTCCGITTGMTGANVNAAAVKNTYCIVQIWRFT